MFMPATTQLDATADSVIEVGPYFCALQVDRGQATLLPECLEDRADESNPIRVIDAFVDALDLRKLGFEGMDPADIGRPAYHPSVHLIPIPNLLESNGVLAFDSSDNGLGAGFLM